MVSRGKDDEEAHKKLDGQNRSDCLPNPTTAFGRVFGGVGPGRCPRDAGARRSMRRSWTSHDCGTGSLRAIGGEGQGPWGIMQTVRSKKVESA